MSGGRVGVQVGCSYRSLRVLPRSSGRARHQAVCSCGWEGPRRQRVEKARTDLEGHELDLIPAAATPGVVRTGDKVFIHETDGAFRTGRFVGVGPDSAEPARLLQFVQIGAGLHAFDLDTRLEPQP